LLIASGDLSGARERLDLSRELAERTRMHVYDTELLRLRAYTANDVAERRHDLEAAWHLARRQDAPIFQLRTATDLFRLDGLAARDLVLAALSRFPQESLWPEVASARTLVE
jgi:hypothetical protein